MEIRLADESWERPEFDGEDRRTAVSLLVYRRRATELERAARLRLELSQVRTRPFRSVEGEKEYGLAVKDQREKPVSMAAAE